MLPDTKLLVPLLPEGFISRPDVLTAMDGAMKKPLTVICAPAGFGKTSLVADWLTYRRIRSAWVSLDATENDPLTFWRSVSAALGQLNKRLFERVWPQFVDIGENDLSAGIQTLLNELTAHSRSWDANRSFYLVLDNFHWVTDQELLLAFSRFLDYCPASLHVLLISRRLPAMGLARRRAEGRLHEVQGDVLKFSQDNAERFLSETMGLKPELPKTREIVSRAEGWIVALHLAALAVREKGAQSQALNLPAPENNALGDYFMSELIAGQSRDIQYFLQSTALLPQFNASLCDASLERADSLEMIGHLRQQNLLTESLGGSGHWYRLHGLFRDWLRQWPLPEKHEEGFRARAANWLETRDHSYEAFEQWVNLGQWGKATRLVMMHFMTWWQEARLSQAEGCLRKFPEHWRRGNPWLLYLESFARFQRGELSNAEQALREAEHCFNDARQPDIGETELSEDKAVLQALDRARNEFPLHITSLRAHIARQAGDIQTSGMLSQDLEKAASLPQSPLLDWTLCGCCTDQFYQMNLPHATDYGIKALHEARRHRNASCQIASLAWLVPALMHQGEHNAAMAWIERTQAEIGPDWQANSWAPNLPYQHALILRENNQLEAADEALDEAFASVTDQLMPHCLVYFYFLRWQLAINRGNKTVAEAAICQIERLHYQQDGRAWNYVVFEPRLLKALLQASIGQPEALLIWAQSFEPVATWDATWLDYAKLSVWLRVQVDSGEDIGGHLAHFRRKAVAGGVVSWQVKAALLEYRQASHQGADDVAMAAIRSALYLSANFAQRRIILDDGPGLEPGLHRCLTDPVLGREAGDLLMLLGMPDQSPQPPCEPLSDRERQVLASLESGHSNPELARQLGVSLSTVKAHLRSIFSKLGVKNRTQAIAHARKSGVDTGGAETSDVRDAWN